MHGYIYLYDLFFVFDSMSWESAETLQSSDGSMIIIYYTTIWFKTYITTLVYIDHLINHHICIWSSTMGLFFSAKLGFPKGWWFSPSLRKCSRLSRDWIRRVFTQEHYTSHGSGVPGGRDPKHVQRSGFPIWSDHDCILIYDSMMMKRPASHGSPSENGLSVLGYDD